MKEWLGTAARLVVGGVWIVAGALKLTDPAESVAAVRAYELLPGSRGADRSATCCRSSRSSSGLLLVARPADPGRRRGLRAAVRRVHHRHRLGVGARHRDRLRLLRRRGREEDAPSSYPWEIARDVALLALSRFLVWLRRTRLALDNLLFPAHPRTRPRARPRDQQEPEDPRCRTRSKRLRAERAAAALREQQRRERRRHAHGRRCASPRSC